MCLICREESICVERKRGVLFTYINIYLCGICRKKGIWVCNKKQKRCVNTSVNICMYRTCCKEGICVRNYTRQRCVNTYVYISKYICAGSATKRASASKTECIHLYILHTSLHARVAVCCSVLQCVAVCCSVSSLHAHISAFYVSVFLHLKNVKCAHISACVSMQKHVSECSHLCILHTSLHAHMPARKHSTCLYSHISEKCRTWSHLCMCVHAEM